MRDLLPVNTSLTFWSIIHQHPLHTSELIRPHLLPHHVLISAPTSPLYSPLLSTPSFLSYLYTNDTNLGCSHHRVLTQIGARLQSSVRQCVPVRKRACGCSITKRMVSPSGISSPWHPWQTWTAISASSSEFRCARGSTELQCWQRRLFLEGCAV